MVISSSDKAAFFLRQNISDKSVEEFWALALNPLCQLIQGRMLFRGTVDSCFIHPRDIFRFALSHNASSLIVGHNHPSGACYPSGEDIDFSRQIKEAGILLQIPIVDHVIITDKGHFSFAERIWKNQRVNFSS